MQSLYIRGGSDPSKKCIKTSRDKFPAQDHPVRYAAAKFKQNRRDEYFTVDR